MTLFDPEETVVRKPYQERFLTGLLAQWLAGADAKPTAVHRERGQEAARAALARLHAGDGR